MKTLILSHKADIDGLSPVIFLNLIRNDIDVILLNANDINPKVTEMIKNKSYLKYDEIFITDLTLNLVSNNYPFGVAISQNENGVNECATSLFYKYLCKEYPETFDNPAMATYTELVRLSDTWDWAKTNNTDANKLGDLLNILGRDEYIDNYTNYFKTEKEEFSFTDNQLYLLSVEEKRIQRYLEEAEKTMFHGTLCGRPCGIVFAEQHRSLLGNYLADKYSYCLDFIVMINMQQGISFRCNKDTVNVGEIATIYGGGGHVKASGAPMDNSLKREVIKFILKDKNMFNK